MGCNSKSGNAFVLVVKLFKSFSSSQPLVPSNHAALLIIAIFSSTAFAEPWIDTRDSWLRADIEYLSDAGIISVPITTYPLMWSGIIQDIDNTEMSDVDNSLKDVFWRVKKAGKAALLTRDNKQLKISLANSEQVLRSFGDSSRTQAELSARRFGLNKNFAWNFEISRVSNPQDEKNTRYDGTYLSTVLGNWVASLGFIDKWWGPGWDSTNLLSNNARAPLGFSLQRNYSNQSESQLVSWLGPWTFNSFIAGLDDDEESLHKSKLTGLSFNFKPHYSLELAFRVTALWGGENQTESLSSLIDVFVANESCDLIVCDENAIGYEPNYYSPKGDRVAGVDFKWRLPITELIATNPISLYASFMGESESQYLPSKNMQQFGLTSSFALLNANWTWFLETSDTRLAKESNIAYESQIYQNGYRYLQRAIGSTFDNDSNVTSFGLITRLNRNNQFNLTISDIKLNRDGQNASDIALHSISESAKDFKKIKLNWSYQTIKNGKFVLTIDHTDMVYDDFSRLDDKTRIGIEWFYGIE